MCCEYNYENIISAQVHFKLPWTWNKKELFISSTYNLYGTKIHLFAFLFTF